MLLQSGECGSWKHIVADLGHDKGLVKLGTKEGRVKQEVERGEERGDLVHDFGFQEDWRDRGELRTIAVATNSPVLRG